MTVPELDPTWGGPARRIDLAALADGAADEPLLDEHGRISEPLLIVDLDAPGPAGPAASAVARADRILVGVASRSAPGGDLRAVLEALDVTLVPAAAEAGPPTVDTADPWLAAEELHAAANVHPQAATVLAGLLRRTGTLPVDAALDAESFAYSTLLGGSEFRTWLDARRPRPAPPPAPAAPVLVDRTFDELRITLNRPERRNAYGREVRDALVAALDVALFDETVHVVLDGAGPSFCAGGDLDEFGTTPDPATAHFVRTSGGAGRTLHRLAGRAEARVHGACVGAGIELPAFTGRVVADPDATFRLPEVGMGLIPGAGGTVSIPRRIGRWRTLHLALGGASIPAARALSWGLVDTVRRHEG
ncbi:enoyl-CoA hydratase/isomerase family protein [Pseudonocardia eucalypti]|uniref:Enoyl-CoA hydratase/isomerase family protein n=1 Tax=Pseudonocardia eucalypti TaxID=648755 RepID=A0ABP9PNE5_9PSEU|nr:hypothetical protein [Pseudonocardia eucalypti]